MENRNSLLKAVVCLSFLMVGSTQAASYQHIDLLALRIQKQAGQLIHEVKLHYSHTPQFRHLLFDVAEMYRSAHHVHEVAHHRGSIHHLSRDLRELDRLFHHVESLIRQVEKAARHGHGHVHCDTRHVKRILRKMANDIHHLENDIAHMKRNHHRRVYRQPVPAHLGYNNGIHRPHVNAKRSGVYFNGNRVHFRIRF